MFKNAHQSSLEQVDDCFKQFEKISDNLGRAVVACELQVKDEDQIIAEAEARKAVQTAAISKASVLITNLKTLATKVIE